MSYAHMSELKLGHLGKNAGNIYHSRGGRNLEFNAPNSYECSNNWTLQDQHQQQLCEGIYSRAIASKQSLATNQI